jgi:tRNA(Ile)-lysidine synthase
MLEKIEAILRDECRLDKSRPVVVGVSGGPDSLCLMDALSRAGYSVVVAHFNHKLRSESDVEAKKVHEVADELSLPCKVESADVRGHASSEGLSIEEAARNLRYAFLFAQARKYGAQAVAVGHTADDQAETVLMHFIRGAGLRGLKGMSYRTLLPVFDPVLPVIRPLLEVWRAETLAYCVSHALHPHYDPSNDSLDFLRNRVRHELMPSLEFYNPRVRETILRNARTVSSDYAWLSEVLAKEWEQVVLSEAADFVALDLARLLDGSPGLQRNLIRLAAGQLAPTQEIDLAALDRAAGFISARSTNHMDLAGGMALLREQDVLYVCKEGARLPAEAWPQMPAQSDAVPVSLPGVTTLAGGWQFSAERTLLPGLASEELSQNRDRFRVWLDEQRLPKGLELRVRHPGDRFEPLGLGGHSQKLSDVFINQKLPARARSRWPLLCAGRKILWVPGYRPAEEFKLHQDTRAAVCFSLAPSADPEISRRRVGHDRNP